MKSKRPLKGPSQGRLPIVISDGSILTGLWKARLLFEMLQLPYEFFIPLPLQRDELLQIKQAEWTLLASSGLIVVDLDPARTADAVALKTKHAELSACDCFSLALARSLSNAVLLTDDAHLCRLCDKDYELSVRGLFWVADELSRLGFIDSERVLQCREDSA